MWFSGFGQVLQSWKVSTALITISIVALSVSGKQTKYGHQESKRILMLPFEMASHVYEMMAMSEALIDRGHDVYMLLGDSMPMVKKVPEGRVKILLHKTSENDEKPPNLKALIESGVHIKPMDTFRGRKSFVNMCHQVLSDKDVMDKIRSLAFDLVIVDGIPFTQCLYILPYKFDVPFATFASAPEPCQTGCPSLPSFVPFPLTGPFTNRMDFWQRLTNAWDLFDWCYNSRVGSKSTELVSQYAPEKPLLSVNEIASKSLLWLVDSDILVDYPRPFMPNEVYVGGLMIKEGKALAENFQKIVENAKDGVIVMSFGSMAPDVRQDLFLRAFSQIKQTVIWRYRGEPLQDVPANVHLFDWLPQADLLAHPNVKLFITHCGANGQMESIYNGVPMLQFPLFAEQPFNALRSEYHGYGLTLRLMAVTPAELVESIHELINNPVYSQNIKKASQIMKSRTETPAQKAASWIEHVLTFGGEHLKAHSLQMPWYQLLMVDVFAFVFGVLVIATFTIYLVIKIAVKIFCGSRPAKVKVN